MNRLGSPLAVVGLAALCGLAPFTSEGQTVTRQGSALFLVNTELGVRSASELDGATICLEAGSPTERLVADYFMANGISYEPLPYETTQEGAELYSNFYCDVFAGEPTTTEQVRQLTQAPEEHLVLPETLGRASSIQVAPIEASPVSRANPGKP